MSPGTTCRSPAAPCGADPYSSIPATSGPHWDPSGIANWGVYTTPQNESQVVHNLEHGGIVIWYDPALLDDAQVAELTSYVQGQVASGISGRYKFILTPGVATWSWAARSPSPRGATPEARCLRHGRHPRLRRPELPPLRAGAERRAGTPLKARIASSVPVGMIVVLEPVLHSSDGGGDTDQRAPTL